MLGVGPVAVVEQLVADAAVVADYLQQDAAIAKLEIDDHQLAGVRIVAEDVKTFVVKLAAGVIVVMAAAAADEIAVVDAVYYVAFAASIEFDFVDRRTNDAVAIDAVDAGDVVIVAGAAAVL